MSEILIAVGIFVLLTTSSMLAMFENTRLTISHRSDETAAAVRNITSIFVVVASLVFGLMLNSAKNTYETINANVHGYATNLIILDRMLRSYGPDAESARLALRRYTEQAILKPARADDVLSNTGDSTGRTLEYVGDLVARIIPADRYHDSLLQDLRQNYNHIVQQRWAIVEQSEGSTPGLLVAMLVAWLVVIFIGFGYRAPRNAMVIGTLVLSALLISGSLYLVMDMNVPFKGPIQVSDQPLRRALQEMERQ
ncbi:DUF4239 domain-containing protein [Terriglobus sp. TAA 43]|uniref:bestrophin-like domain n=1 Tax=Terriglobus sp. TAA 43 TaxID=278961 RepID=UPI000648CE15|nr:DUF4239 domain-containing protein [Terriglobus sp. TAA 43]